MRHVDISRNGDSKTCRHMSISDVFSPHSEKYDPTNTDLQRLVILRFYLYLGYIFIHLFDAVIRMRILDDGIFMHISHSLIFMHILDAVIFMHMLDAGIFVDLSMIFPSYSLSFGLSPGPPTPPRPSPSVRCSQTQYCCLSYIQLLYGIC